MDLRTMKRKRRMLTLDGNIIYADDQSQPSEVQRNNECNDSAGDHIMRLYKFLADKSKKIRDEKAELERENETNNNNNQDNNNLYAASAVLPNEASGNRFDELPQAQDNSKILANKSAMNGETRNYATINRYDSKRDIILLKVRHHIYERKRQRRLAQLLVKDGLSVWRPW